MQEGLPIRFTRHARNRMRWHHIDVAEVEACLKNPETVEPAIGGKTHSWQRTDNGFVRVTWIRANREILVITSVRKHRPPGR